MAGRDDPATVGHIQDLFEGFAETLKKAAQTAPAPDPKTDPPEGDPPKNDPPKKSPWAKSWFGDGS
jgi:hypothetical protein